MAGDWVTWTGFYISENAKLLLFWFQNFKIICCTVYTNRAQNTQITPIFYENFILHTCTLWLHFSHHWTGLIHPIKLILGCWLYSMVQTGYKNQQNGSGLWMEFQLEQKMFKLTKIKFHNLYLESSEAKCSLHTDLPAKTHYIQCTIYIDLKSTLVNNVIKYANIEHCMTCTNI